jgi:hypothetical protein
VNHRELSTLWLRLRLLAVLLLRLPLTESATAPTELVTGVGHVAVDPAADRLSTSITRKRISHDTYR